MPNTPPCIECKHMWLDTERGYADGESTSLDMCTLAPKWEVIPNSSTHTCGWFKFLPGGRSKDPTVCETENCDNKRDFQWATVCGECRSRLEEERQTRKDSTE